MKMKFGIIAAALAAGFSGQANALIDNGTSGNGELFLTVWDTTTQTSYTRGLGLNMNSFLTNGGVTLGTSAAAFSATGDTSANNYSLAADANLTSFLTGAAAGITAGTLQWSVVAYDTTGLGYGGRRFLFTSGSAPSVVANNVNSQTGNMASGALNYVGTVNTFMPAGSVNFDMASIKTTAAAGSLAYPDAASNGFSNNFGNFLSPGATNTATALGQSLSFYLMTPSSTSGTAVSTSYQFQNANGLSNWTLGANGTLTYTTASVAAVPEPSEIGLMLSGFGLVGFLASKRRKALTRG